MSRKPSSVGPAEPAPKLDMQRVRVNAQGYDASGAYWGAGPDVFLATTADGAEEITVRACTVAEARQKAAAELTRTPDAIRTGKREPIGGASPRKTRYEIDWKNPVTSETVRLRITHARDYLSQGTDHLEIQSIKPDKAPLPITATGYLSHFIAPLDLINAGGPVTFVTAWIEREASGKAWTKTATAKAQGDLFHWADAKSEVSAKRKAKPTKPAGKPIKKPARGRAPR